MAMAIAMVLLGCILRFGNLGLKPYWFDEVSTGLQLSGFSDAAVVAALTDGQAHRLGDVLAQFQYPSSQTHWLDTVRGLAQKEPQLTPVYFLFARFWTALLSPLLGTSIALVRSSATLWSLVVLPLVFGVCRSLFGSTWVAWVAVALTSLSPFQLLQAQEARPYSLWIVWLLASSWLLLWLARKTLAGRMSRGGLLLGWSLYGLMGMLGLYTQLLMGPVLLVHCLYLLAMALRQGRFWRLWPYGLSGVAILASLLPWILGPVLHAPATANERWGQAIPLMTLVRGWANNFSLFFLDYNLDADSPFWWPFVGLVALLGLFGCYALYDLILKTPIEVWGFVGLMVLIPAAVVIVPDLLLGSDQSTFRYMSAAYLMLHLVVAHLVGSRLEAHWADRRQPLTRWFWGSCLGLLLLLGGSSGLLYVQAPTWWSKGEGTMNRELAAILNRVEQPTLVTNAYFIKVFSLGHLLNPDTALLLFPEERPIVLKTLPAQAYLFSPSEETRRDLGRHYRLEEIPIPLSSSLAASPELVPSIWHIQPLTTSKLSNG